MAFSATQAWSGSTTFGTSLAKAYTNVPTAGNLLVALVGFTSDASFTSLADDIGDGVSWTDSGIKADNGYRDLWLYYKVVGTPSGGGKTVTLTCSASTGMVLAVVEYTAGTSMTYSLDGTPTDLDAQVGTDPSIGPITLAGSVGVVVSASVNAGSIDYTSGGGFTERYYTTNYSNTDISDQFTSASGNYTATRTGASATWSALLVGFKAEAAASSGGVKLAGIARRLAGLGGGLAG